MDFPIGIFQYIVKSYEAHDKSCKSLKYLWMGHSGGVTSFSDVFDCASCEVTFYNDGLYVIDDEVGYEQLLCACCYDLTVLSEIETV